MKNTLQKFLFAVFCALFISNINWAQNGCLNNWTYQQPITVTNANASALNSFQVRLQVNTAALIGQGKMNLDGSDIRFIDECCNELCYVIEDYMNTDTTLIWVNVPNIPASGTATIHMAYGNVNATTTSDASCVFDIYEDFDSGSQSTFLNGCGTISETITAGEYTTNWSGSGMVLSNTVLPQTSRYTIESMVTGTSGSWPALYFVKSTQLKSYGLMANTSQARISVTGGGSQLCSGHNWASSLQTFTSTSGLWSFTWANTGDLRADFPTVGAITTTDNLYALDEDLQVAIGGISSGTGSITMDWIRVRKFAEIDPSSAFGAEGSPSSITVQLVNFPSNTENFCPQSSVTLDAGSGFSTMIWSTGDTTQTIFVNTPGQYYVDVVDGGGCPSSDTVVVSEYPVATGFLGADTMTCPGNSVMLSVGSGFSTQTWSTGDTSQMILAGAGQYFVNTIDTNGCATADTIDVTNYTLPGIDLGIDTAACAGDTIILDAGAGFTSYSWSSSANTSQTEQVIATGSIIAFAVDQNGCTNSDTINVTIEDPTASFSSSVSFWDATFTDASTNAVSWSWDFGDGTGTSTDQNPTYTYATTGTFNVCLTVTDAQGCTNTYCEDVTIDNAGLLELDANLFQITPNPATDVINVTSLSSETLDFQLMDLSGKAVKAGTITSGTNTIEIAELPAGIYVLQIGSENAIYTERVAKQ